MGVNCKIIVNKPRSGIYRPGDEVTGRVQYAIDEATEYKNIVISFIGKGRCEWTEHKGNWVEDYEGKEKYVSAHINILESKGETAIVPAGTYEHPFSFFIPDSVPSSHKDKYSHIYYKIKLKFEKPNFFSLTKKFSTEITVRSFVNPALSEGPIVYGINKTLSKPLSTKDQMIHLKAEILNSFLTASENIEIKYEVANNTNETATVITELFKKLTYTAKCSRQKIKKKKEFCTESPSILENSTAKLSVIVPTSPEMYTIQNSKVIALEYVIIVTIRLPIPHRNAHVEMFVVVGEKISNDTVTNTEAEDTPPSYWEVMAEDEKLEKKKF